MLVVLAVVFYIAQSVMPYAVVNRLIEEYNTNGISAVLRADNILDVQLSSRPGSTFGLGDNQMEALKENEIFPYEYGTGTVLAYKTYDDSWRFVAGTAQQGVDPSSISAYLPGAFPDYDFGSFGGARVITVAEAFDDASFKNPYTRASKTWRGGNSGWYDELADLGENIHGYQRSRWFKYAAKTTSTTVKNAFESIAKSSLAASGTNTSVTRGQGSYETGQTHTTEGGEVVQEVATESYDANDSSMVGKGAENAKTQVAAKFLSMATNASEIVCAAVEGFMGVQTLVSTYQRVQKLNLASGFMEAVQSVQAGSTTSEPMHEYNKRLTETDPETNTNGMMSDGMDALFNNTPIEASSPSTQAVNTEATLSNIANSQDEGSIMALFADIVGSGNKILRAYEFCGYLTGGLAIASAVVTVLSVIPIIGQGIAAISLTAKEVVKAAVKAAISAAAPIIARKVVEYAGNLLIKDLATEWLGEDLGSALVASGNTLLSANHQIGAGSPGSSAKVGAFKRAQQQVIAEEAEYERATRSPLDITSPHTFLGSMVYSLVPMANSVGLGTTLKSLSSVMTNSMTQILPTASAVAETNMVSFAKEGDCPNLEEVGIQGDVYCNPLYMTDEDTITEEYTPSEIIKIEKEWGYITTQEVTNSSGGTNIKIDVKSGTNLSRYITYCGQRTSSWGIADANIASAINSEGNGPGKTILSYIPLVSDVVTVIDSANKIENLPWTTGSACVASESNEYWCENKIHQRFIEDQRFYENTDTGFDNAVVAYIKDYYEEHPLDNSFEGILARYSGMTKEDVISTIELIQGLDYIAKYKPSERTESLAMVEKKEDEAIYFEDIDSESSVVTVAAEPKYIVYNTLRNRTVLV